MRDRRGVGEEVGVAYDEATKLFGNSIPRASKAYSIRIYVDALDECGEEVARDLVAYFQRLTSKSPLTETTLSICFSCRHFPIVALAHGLTISVENENNRDIATYVQGELKGGISDKSKVQELEVKIVDKASGVSNGSSSSFLSSSGCTAKEGT